MRPASAVLPTFSRGVEANWPAWPQEGAASERRSPPRAACPRTCPHCTAVNGPRARTGGGTRLAYRAAKRAIGRRAAEMVVDGDSIGLDIGTTTLEIVSGLSNKHNLTIVTASLPIANAVVSQLALGVDVRLILAGGILRAGELSMIGPIAALTAQHLHVDKAFIAIGGLSLEDGLTEYNLEDAEVKRPLLHNAQRKIVVADGSKLGRTTFASIGPLSLVDTVVTDQSAPPETVHGLQQMGIEVVVVEADCAD